MPLPTILAGILISTLYGALFHLLRGGSLQRFMFYLILAWVGFWGGELLGWYLDWSILALGMMNAGTATLGSWLFLLIGDWVSRISIRRNKE